MSLSAASLEWSWKDGGEGVSFYRYQLNGEDENKWTVVDGTTTSVILDSGSSSNTLYLQASYDGVNWSESTKGTYSFPNTVKSTDDIGYVDITWENDKDYNYFRYQRDGEREDGWTVVEGKSGSVTLPYHKGLNTYYVQSSWDGLVWSESGICTYLYSQCTCDTLLWSWEKNDDGVNYFRWQRDEKRDDGWSVVDSSVNEVELPAHEGENTLYVEASYDMENWSETSVGTYLYELKPYRTRKWEVSLKVLPYSCQRINYTIENTPEQRGSVYGGGAGAEFRYNISSLFSIAGTLSTEHYKYKSFHVYHDFKFLLTTGVNITGSGSSRNKVYLTFGGGADLVIRDDGEKGCYPLVTYGIRDTFSLSDKLSLSLDVSLNHTFQNGSNVIHILPSIGINYTWGCKAGCTGCEGGCR